VRLQHAVAAYRSE